MDTTTTRRVFDINWPDWANCLTFDKDGDATFMADHTPPRHQFGVWDCDGQSAEAVENVDFKTSRYYPYPTMVYITRQEISPAGQEAIPMLTVKEVAEKIKSGEISRIYVAIRLDSGAPYDVLVDSDSFINRLSQVANQDEPLPGCEIGGGDGASLYIYQTGVSVK